MLKKIINNFCLIIICLLSVVSLSACCSPKDVKVNVVFYDVDPNMGVTTYSEDVAFGENLTVEFLIPEGYEHSGMTAKIGNKEFEYEVVYSDENEEDEYKYSVEKTIKLTIRKVTSKFDLVFDMSQVRKKQCEINVDNALIGISQTNNDNFSSNLKIITVKPESVNNLIKLNNEVVTGEKNFLSNTVSVDYGEYVLLCYTKNVGKSEIPVVYSDVGHFTKEEDILTTSAIDYVCYNVAQRGNTYYNLYENGVANASTRVYYIGKIQENINLYNNIPNLELAKGFEIDNENIFTLLTNKQDYNSDLLTIDIFKPTNLSYNSSITSLDKVENIVVEKIEKYNDNSELKNSYVLSEFNNRYDAYNMYVGDNIEFDPFLNSYEKQSISNSLYISINTQDFLKDHININLLTYEKQNYYDLTTYKLVLNEYITSTKGERFYKIDADVVSEFLLNRAQKDSLQNVIQYKTGNAILYVEIDPNYIDTTRLNHTFPYSSINYPTTYGTKSGIVDPNYKIEFYILNEDGSKDYGFLDMHKYGEDIVFFETDKLWKSLGNGEWECLNNLYVTIIGPDYNDYYSPIIKRIYMVLNYDGDIVTGGIPIEDATVLNGIQDYPVDLSGMNDEPYSVNQYKIAIALGLSDLNTDYVSVDFNNMEFVNSYNDAIFVTNDINFNELTDFNRIDFFTSKSDVNIDFGSTVDIYYFVMSDTELDFDVYVGQKEEGTDLYVGIQDEKRLISATKKLYDIAGNEVIIKVNGIKFNVYVKYQNCDVYDLQGNEHFAFNN